MKKQKAVSVTEKRRGPWMCADLHAALKMSAAKQGISMEELAARLLRADPDISTILRSLKVAAA